MLPGLEAVDFYSYGEIGYASFIYGEEAGPVGCGHSLHSDLQIHKGDLGAGNRAKVESRAVSSIPNEKEVKCLRGGILSAVRLHVTICCRRMAFQVQHCVLQCVGWSAAHRKVC